MTNPAVSSLSIIDEWPLLVADFASEYHIRLAALSDADMSWREFWMLTSGLLLQQGSRLYRKFAPEREE